VATTASLLGDSTSHSPKITRLTVTKNSTTPWSDSYFYDQPLT
jgi:hypothetical protein